MDLATIMTSRTPPAERARTMAQQLDGALIAGTFDRLNSDGRCDLRALVWALEQLADDLAPQRVVDRRRPWWRNPVKVFLEPTYMPLWVWLALVVGSQFAIAAAMHAWRGCT